MILNEEIKEIQEKFLNKSINLTVEFTYFIPDFKKDGGKYVTVCGVVKKIDEYRKCITIQCKDNYKNIEDDDGEREINKDKEYKKLDNKLNEIIEIPIKDIINIEFK